MAWRHRDNHDRPHDAQDLGVPADRYRPSPRAFRQKVEPFDHAVRDFVRSVHVNGRFSFEHSRIKPSKALNP